MELVGGRGDGSAATAITILLSLLCILHTLDTVSGSPIGSASEQLDEMNAVEGRDDERRATWLETRNLESNFKQLVYLSLKELANEGRIDPRLLEEKIPEKRGRHQGFCFRKTKSGRFLPYICWKGEGDHEEK